MPVKFRHAAHLLIFLLVFAVAACGSPAPPAASVPSTLLLFATSTQAATQTPEIWIVAETPLPTSTPFAYTVQQGDTISSIALKYGVSMDDLIEANPDVSPNAMSVGAVISIPGHPANPSGEPTPTPAPFTIQQVACHPTADRGMWCFVLAHNDFPDLLENVSAQVTLVDAAGAALASQTSLLPLNILPPNSALPLTVFFPPQVLLSAKPQVQVLTAIRLLSGDERYLPATVNNVLVQVNADGRSGRVNGQVFLPEDSPAAAQVWVVGTAYDAAGIVVGVRKWEWNDGLGPGGNLPFEFGIFSLGGRIERVEFAVEARP